MTVRYDVTFTGRVQGVFFRATAVDLSSGFDVRGWVRNQSDGSVRLVAEGTERELHAFIEAIKDAKRGNIDDVRVDRGASTGEFVSFEIRR